MADDLVRITLRLPPELHERLLKLAESNLRGTATEVRRIVQDYFDEIDKHGTEI